MAHNDPKKPHKNPHRSKESSQRSTATHSDKKYLQRTTATQKNPPKKPHTWKRFIMAQNFQQQPFYNYRRNNR